MSSLRRSSGVGREDTRVGGWGGLTRQQRSSDLVALQRAAGNRAVAQLLAEQQSSACEHCAGNVVADTAPPVECTAAAVFLTPTQRPPRIKREKDGSVSAKGKLLLTFAKPQVSIQMASPPPGVSKCEAKLYQAILDSDLKKHEKEHKRRYQVTQAEEPENSFRGTHVEDIDDTAATADDFSVRWQELADVAFSGRKDRSQAFATLIDPFSKTVDTTKCGEALE